MREFSKRLGELCESNDISKSRLAEALGVARSTANRWLEGTRSVDLKNAIRLCEFFNCSLEFLTGKTDVQLDFKPKVALEFYSQLKSVMQKRNISRYRICIDLKKSHNHFDNWKRGIQPTLQTVVEFADYFKMTVDEFVGRE